MNDSPFNCSLHGQMAVTQSGLQHVCVNSDCDEHVRAYGPREKDPVKEKSEMRVVNTVAAAKITLPAKADPKARLAAVEEAAKLKKKLDGGKAPVAEAKPAKKPKAERAAKPERDPDVLTVSDIARETGVDPKRARARLRAAGLGAVEGRWPTVKKDSKQHAEFVAIINPPDGEPAETEEDDEE